MCRNCFYYHLIVKNFIFHLFHKISKTEYYQGCTECGMPVGIYLLNDDQGLKMCSNKMCDWPVTEEFLQIYNFHNVEFKEFNPNGLCENVDLEEIKKLSTHITANDVHSKQSSAPKIKKSKRAKIEEKKSDKQQNYSTEKNCILSRTFSESNKDIEEDNEGKVTEENINIERESETENAIEETLNKDSNEVMDNDDEDERAINLEIEDELHIDECLAKAKAKLVSITSSNKNKTNITNPWMLRQLRINQIHGGKRKTNTCEEKELQKRIHLKIDTETVAGPAITIQFDDIEPTLVSNTTIESLNNK